MSKEALDGAFDGIEKEVNERFEGYFPGLSEKVDGLICEQYGRGIRIKRDEKDPQSKDKVVGCVLPLNNENTKHLFILKNGSIFVTEPVASGYEYQYKNTVISQTHDLVFSRNQTLSSIEYAITKGEIFCNKIVLSYANPSQVELIKQAVQEAVDLAKSERERRERAREEAARNAINKISEFLDPRNNTFPGETSE